MSEKIAYTQKEFCQAVGISLITAWRLRRMGKLPYCRIGQRIYYTPQQIKAFLDANSRNN
jgi:predicted site-specific integrase-resolvase